MYIIKFYAYLVFIFTFFLFFVLSSLLCSNYIYGETINLNIRFLGVGGADLTPHASILLNEDLIIDFGEGTLTELKKYLTDLKKIKTILYTHPDADHWDENEFKKFLGERNSTAELFIGGGNEIYNVCNILKQIYYPYIICILFDPTKPSISLDQYYIKPLYANHCTRPNNEVQGCLVYIVANSSGRKILYGTDSRLFKQQTLNEIYQRKFDLIIRDGTFDDTPPLTHMNCATNIQERNDFITHGVITNTTPWIMTHKGRVRGSYSCLPGSSMSVAYAGMFISLTNQLNANTSSTSSVLPINNTPTSVKKLIESHPSDLNDDKRVDKLDFNLLMSNFFSHTCNLKGDINKDCNINIIDYNLLLTDYGKIY